MKEKKKFKMPDTYVLIVMLIIIMCLLTHVIPAGQYDVVEGTKMVVAGSYHHVDSNPAGIADFLNSFMGGLQSGATTIFLVLLIGGSFQILMNTGSVDAMLALALKKSQGKYTGIIATIAVVMSILGALGVGNNVALAFIPIMVILCRKLRLDSIVVVAIMYFASNLGFSGSPMNPFTVLLAQDIADIPQMSGFLPRCLMWLVFTIIGTLWTVHYCKKIHNNPEKSITGIYELTDEDLNDMDKMPEIKPTHFINMGILVAVFGVYAYGGIKYNWDISVLGNHGPWIPDRHRGAHVAGRDGKKLCRRCKDYGILCDAHWFRQRHQCHYDKCEYYPYRYLLSDAPASLAAAGNFCRRNVYCQLYL